MKVKYKGGGNPYEFAKDVAAFANHLGGTILLGAHEDIDKGTIREYVPLTADECKHYEDQFSDAVRNKCFPNPRHWVVRYASGEGFVLAINVDPSVSTLIGVQAKVDGGKEGYDGSGWTFPLRVGRDTDYIRPEAFPMHMLPTLRRVSILLAAIGSEILVLKQIAESGHATHDNHYYFVDAREEQNALILKLARKRGLGWESQDPEVIRHYPLDQVRTVFKDHEGKWNVLLDFVPH